MDMVEIITKKRDGGVLTREEIAFFVEGCVKGTVPEYQASALLMAIYFRGLDREETFALTRAMRDSGEVVDLSGIPGVKVDKHSTGGVGDKTTLIAAPIAAAAGVKIAKMSGRGLGFTGGTADKLEAIPGFRTHLTTEAFFRQVRDVGLAVVTQTAKITPADKILYALRDVTGTVENRSLIAASVMSKKLASGSDAIVLDVKCGNGAFLREQAEAEALAKLMIAMGEEAGRKVVAVISDMDQPLGLAVGNALEVQEAIRVLRGEGPEDVKELSLVLASTMIYLGGCADSTDEARRLAEELLANGAGLAKLRAMIVAQGGDGSVCDNEEAFPHAGAVKEVRAEKNGFVTAMDTKRIGEASQRAGAGRTTKEETVDPAAGILLNRKCGEPVEEGTLLATVYGSDEEKVAHAAELALSAYEITEKRPVPKRPVKAMLDNSR